MSAITRKADYGARVVLHLARLQPGAWTTAQVIAQEESIPGRLIRHVVSSLASAGLILTRRGRGGGLRLARDAAEVSLLEVVEAIDGPLRLNICVGDDAEGCVLEGKCSVHEAWVRAQEVLEEQLSQETFDKLARCSKALGAQ